MKTNHDYECSVCKRGVLVLPNEKPIRACEHTNAPIHANMSATVSQSGGVTPAKPA